MSFSSWLFGDNNKSNSTQGNTSSYDAEVNSHAHYVTPMGGRSDTYGFSFNGHENFEPRRSSFHFGARTHENSNLFRGPENLEPRRSSFHFGEQSQHYGGGPSRCPTRFTLVNALLLHSMVFVDLDVISCSLHLIRSCPNLTKLVIKFCRATDIVVEQVVNYLEAPACMDQTLAKLLSVDITFLKGLKPQLLLIKLLLACSPKLETMVIGLSPGLDVNGGFQILKELSQFPRLSPKAVVKYS
ncbi:hypothetical protein Vadar_025695 [Vaccinium darrowii]|uniref:Uncharacterized protein n=1 Tax=Vaccinium darrowii TaxID=229202 RepID=A0ACB7XL75_9ERIC|nr:hypothetical protein Vadar_025695 [Vaccinium darrowii]